MGGTTHRWSAPPLVGGRRLHPGEDFNCRCWAEPIPSREQERIAKRKARAR
jgi:uncharacterized protein with gpF-like domain